MWCGVGRGIGLCHVVRCRRRYRPLARSAVYTLVYVYGMWCDVCERKIYGATVRVTGNGLVRPMPSAVARSEVRTLIPLQFKLAFEYDASSSAFNSNCVFPFSLLHK